MRGVRIFPLYLEIHLLPNKIPEAPLIQQGVEIERRPFFGIRGEVAKIPC
jgi:hypothetical protein